MIFIVITRNIAIKNNWSLPNIKLNIFITMIIVTLKFLVFKKYIFENFNCHDAIEEHPYMKNIW